MTGTKSSRYQMASLVKPDALCHGNPNRDPKYAFITEEKAAQALAHARRNHEALGAEKVEDRYYPCPYGTSSLVPFNARVDLSDIVEHFHLTSQPPRADDEEQS